MQHQVLAEREAFVSVAGLPIAGCDQEHEIPFPTSSGLSPLARSLVHEAMHRDALPGPVGRLDKAVMLQGVDDVSVRGIVPFPSVFSSCAEQALDPRWGTGFKPVFCVTEASAG